MTLKYKGYIRYFDNISGEGVVRIPELDNKCYFFHYSADTRYKKFPTKQVYDYKQDTPIECTLFIDSHFTQVNKISLSSYCTIDDIKSDRIIEMLELNAHDLYLFNSIYTEDRQEFIR